MQRLNLFLEEKTTISRYKDFINEKKCYLSESTIKTYNSHFTLISKLIDVNADVTDFLCYELYEKISDYDMTDSAKNAYLSTWRSFIHWVDPSLPSPHLKKTEACKEPYTKEEISKLIIPPKKYDFSELRDYVMTLVLLDTGMRSKSLREIRCKDVQEDSILIHNTKSHKIQTAYIGETTQKWIRKYKEQIAVQFSPNDYFFCSIYGNQLSVYTVYDSLKKFNEKRGVSAGVHKYRHTFAKNAIMNGVDSLVLKQMLGHQTLSTTNIYVNLFSSDIKEHYVSTVDGSRRSKIKLR